MNCHRLARCVGPTGSPLLACFYFHLVDGEDRIIDPEGRDVADASLLPALALYEARSIMSHDILVGRLRLDQSIQVRDSDGEVVHELAFRDAVRMRDRPPLRDF